VHLGSSKFRNAALCEGEFNVELAYQMRIVGRVAAYVDDRVEGLGALRLPVELGGDPYV